MPVNQKGPHEDVLNECSSLNLNVITNILNVFYFCNSQCNYSLLLLISQILIRMADVSVTLWCVTLGLKVSQLCIIADET